MADKGIHFRDARGPDGVVVYAIGDVHGRLDLLTRMHDEIAADRARRGARDWRIVHLGDYVDRGPDSCGVVEFLMKASDADERFVCLTGNHDVGFLDFLADPNPDGMFMRFGGVETAQSYGVTFDLASVGGFASSHAKLVAAVPQAHRDFLESLNYWTVSGDFFFCHAGIRPGIALDGQDPHDLIWIRQEFHRHARLYPKVIVHGHTPTRQPEVAANRVNVDTGAFMTGVLTALVIDGVEKQLISISEEPPPGSDPA